MAAPIGSNSGKAALLLTAAGLSSRFQSNGERASASLIAPTSQDKPGRSKKEYLSLEGLPVLFRALEPFLHFSEIDTIIITVPPGDEEAVRELLYNCKAFPSLLGQRLLRIVPGGKCRQGSVLLGLEALYQTWAESESESETELALIHDGARPWITEGIIRAVIDAARIYGSAIPVEPTTSAMKEIDDKGMILHHLPRKTTVAAQTPQTFAFPAILYAHRAVQGDGRIYIDDGEVFSAYGRQVKSVPGDPENKKITYRSDLS